MADRLKFDVKFLGYQALNNMLISIGPKVWQKSIRKALNEAAKPIRDTAKKLAPKRTGALSKSISVKVTAKTWTRRAELARLSKTYSQSFGGAPNDRKFKAYARIGPRRGFSMSKTFGKSGQKWGYRWMATSTAEKKGRKITGARAAKPTRYAHLVEFGTPGMAERPFMRTAYEMNKRKAIIIMGRILGRAVRVEGAKKIGRSIRGRAV